MNNHSQKKDYFTSKDSESELNSLNVNLKKIFIDKTATLQKMLRFQKEQKFG